MENGGAGLWAKARRRASLEFNRLTDWSESRVLEMVPRHRRYRRGMIDMEASLRNSRLNGFSPQTILDIGAFAGDWTRMAARVFPGTPIYMFEANPEREPSLALTVREIPQAHYQLALLGPSSAPSVTFHVGGTGSSVLKEITSIPQQSRTLPMSTLDDLLRDQPIRKPCLLKMDVQGYELEILKGAPETLDKSELVLLEAALLPYNEGAPLFAEVVQYMCAKGFLAYDIAGFYRRETDDALFMTDVLFARADSSLRARKDFWRVEAQFR